MYRRQFYSILALIRFCHMFLTIFIWAFIVRGMCGSKTNSKCYTYRPKYSHEIKNIKEPDYTLCYSGQKRIMSTQCWTLFVETYPALYAQYSVIAFGVLATVMSCLLMMYTAICLRLRPNEHFLTYGMHAAIEIKAVGVFCCIGLFFVTFTGCVEIWVASGFEGVPFWWGTAGCSFGAVIFFMIDIYLTIKFRPTTTERINLVEVPVSGSELIIAPPSQENNATIVIINHVN